MKESQSSQQHTEAAPETEEPIIPDEKMKEITNKLDEAQALIKWPPWVRHTNVNLIKNLQCFEVVRRHVIDGVPLVEIARLLRDLGELTEVDFNYVTESLRHYRATLPKGELLATRITPKPLEEKLKRRIDITDDLLKLKGWAFERLEIAMNRERTFGMPLPNNEKSFQVALDILSKIQEIQEKQIGDVEKVRQEAQSWSRTDFDQLYGKPGINDTLKNPVSRMKIARFLDQTMQLVGGMDDQKRAKILEEAKKQVEVLPPEGTSDQT